MTDEAQEYFIVSKDNKDRTIEFYVRLKNMMRVHIKDNSLEFKLGDFSLKAEYVKADKDEINMGGKTYFRYFLKNADYKKEPK